MTSDNPALEDYLPVKSKKEQRAELKAAIALAELSGFVVHKPLPKDATARTISLDEIKGGSRIKLAVVSCTHFGSKYQQPTALRDFCEYAVSEGVDAIIHAGDLEDGPVDRHKNPQEVFKHDYDAMLDYCVEAMPNVGVPWYIISGNHDDWWTLGGGPDMIRALCDRRDDFTYLGKSLGYLTFGDVNIEVTHLNTGTGYAYSYKPQKHIESLDPMRKPNVALIGNFHKFCAIYYRNVLGIQLPSFQRQSAWMAGKSLVSEVGGVIVEVGLTKKGLAPSTKFEVVYTFEPKENDWP